MYDTFISVGLHLLELLVVIGVTLLLVKVLHVNSGTQEILIGLVLAGLAKFARTSEASPIPDYTR